MTYSGRRRSLDDAMHRPFANLVKLGEFDVVGAKSVELPYLFYLSFLKPWTIGSSFHYL